MATSYRKLPINITNSDIDLFKHELKGEYNKARINIYNNIYLNGNGCFISYKELPETLIRCSSFYKFKNKFIFFKHIFKKKIKNQYIYICASVIWGTDNWTNGYFHWMLDFLPRLFIFNENYQNTLLLLPYHLSLFSFVPESLKLLGITNYRFLDNTKIYRIKNILFPVHLAGTGNYNDQIVEQLRCYCRSNIKVRNKPSDRIFISRKKASRRKIINEEEMLPILKSFGFEVVFLEDYTWEEQVSFFYNCNCLIGLHGAGLANMVFMDKKTKVLELRMKGDRDNNCYFSLASALDIDYYYLLCEAESIDEPVLDNNFFIPVDKFKEILIEIFSNYGL